MLPYFVHAVAVVALCSAFVTAADAVSTGDAPKDGAEFLRSVIQHLHRERGPASTPAPTTSLTPPTMPPMPMPPPDLGDSPDDTAPKKLGYKITAPTPVPQHGEESAVEVVTGAVAPPPPPLSKAELLALYRAASAKGASLSPDVLKKLQGALAAGDRPAAGRLPGFYYYYYPLKSFMPTEPSTNAAHEASSGKNPHAHMVPTAMMVMEGGEDGQHGVEPLFVAMAGFVGAALAFAASVLFLPRLGTLRVARAPAALLPRPVDDLALMVALAGAAATGRDCSERLVCEAGRVARRWNLDGRPLKILELLLPPNMGRHVADVRKSATRREKCGFIPCRSKKLP